jgi:hypothetical protein
MQRREEQESRNAYRRVPHNFHPEGGW